MLIAHTADGVYRIEANGKEFIVTKIKHANNFRGSEKSMSLSVSYTCKELRIHFNQPMLLMSREGLLRKTGKLISIKCPDR